MTIDLAELRAQLLARNRRVSSSGEEAWWVSIPARELSALIDAVEAAQKYAVYPILNQHDGDLKLYALQAALAPFTPKDTP